MKRGLVCLVGEPFRTGGQFCRNRDSDEAYDPQKLAAESVVEFMDHISSAFGTQLDVFISSYRTRWEEDLKSWYGQRLVGSAFCDGLVGLERLVEIARERVDIARYDFVLALRVDLFLKEHFRRVFDPNWDKIMYPSACWVLGHIIGGRPRVSDVMGFFPRAAYGSRMLLNHEAFLHYADQGMGESVGFMIETFHDSDSSKDYNPLYRMVGRPEKKIWRSYGLISDGLNPVEVDAPMSFDDWTVLDNMPVERLERMGIRNQMDIESLGDVWELWSTDQRGVRMFSHLVRLSSYGCLVDGERPGFWASHGNFIMLMDSESRPLARLNMEKKGLYSGVWLNDQDRRIALKKCGANRE